MDLGFSLIIMLKQSVFVEAIEAVWIQYRIGVHQFQTNQAAYWSSNSFAHKPQHFFNVQNLNLSLTVSGWSEIYASKN